MFFVKSANNTCMALGINCFVDFHSMKIITNENTFQEQLYSFNYFFLKFMLLNDKL